MWVGRWVIRLGKGFGAVSFDFLVLMTCVGIVGANVG